VKEAVPLLSKLVAEPPELVAQILIQSVQFCGDAHLAESASSGVPIISCFQTSAVRSEL
jgi:hypothetical protein